MQPVPLVRRSLLSNAREKGSSSMMEQGHGSATARRANAKAAKEGEKNPRKSSAAQAELGKKGGKASKG
jgi:hypothetical protein